MLQATLCCWLAVAVPWTKFSLRWELWALEQFPLDRWSRRRVNKLMTRRLWKGLRTLCTCRDFFILNLIKCQSWSLPHVGYFVKRMIFFGWTFWYRRVWWCERVIALINGQLLWWKIHVARRDRPVGLQADPWHHNNSTDSTYESALKIKRFKHSFGFSRFSLLSTWSMEWKFQL